MNFRKSLLAMLITLTTNVSIANTITIVTKGASENNSTYLSATCDSYKADPSLLYIKEKINKADSKRAIYPSALISGVDESLGSVYVPRINSTDRSSLYYYPNKPLTKEVGFIPEVKTTYAYLDGESGIVNEKGLMIATSRAYVKNFKKVSYKNGGILNAHELARIALERCDSAKKAINIMGALINLYGFYGLPAIICVADKTDAYTMEILPLKDDKKGLWVAKKITDGSIYISADSFRIDVISDDDPTLIMQENLISRLKEKGMAKVNEDNTVSWIKSVKAKEKRPYYSLRRIWRATSLLDTENKFSPWTQNYLSSNYPFEITPTKKVSLQELMNLHRDTFKGTQFDPSTTKTGGFFASPYSYEDLKNERAFCAPDTTYTYINEVSDNLPVPICYFSIGTPAESSFIPLTVNELPDAYSKVDRKKYDSKKLYWVANKVSTLTKAYYYTMIDTVKVAALSQEQKSLATIANYKELSAKDFTSLLNANAISSITDTKKLYQKLLENHDNGRFLRYAQGHNPNFVAVETYSKEENIKRNKEKTQELKAQ